MVGYIFAGQGSQYIGMGKGLYEGFAESKAIFDRAESASGFDLKKFCFEGSEDELKSTTVSQPAILTVSIASYEAFRARHRDLKPAFLAGLSLGEYSALIAARTLSFEEGIGLVRQRSRIMEEEAACRPGKMAAVIDLPFDKIKDICFSSGAEIANINAPGQIVISGANLSVDKAIQLCEGAGARRVIPLAVSGGFHSSLMKEAGTRLKTVLENVTVSNAEVPVISNYTAMPETEPKDIKDNLVSQMYSSVRWEDSMRFMIKVGVKKMFEFGPGNVLKGLMRRIDPSIEVISIEKKADIDSFAG